MGTERAFLAAFASAHALADDDERRRVIRQGLAMLSQLAEREPAPLEGLDPRELARAASGLLADRSLSELDWLSPPAAAIALFELAHALPPGAERRELGRRVLVRLRAADRDTFVRLVAALARSSPRLLAGDGIRARCEVVLATPIAAPNAAAIGELALGLLAQPTLATSWVVQPATGSLPARRLAARVLAHGAREATRRHGAHDRGATAIFAQPAIRDALTRLLGDREAFVWRFAAIARGLLAHVDPRLADDIDRELRMTASSTELRRGAASAFAALELGGAAERWAEVVAGHAVRDSGAARGAILGIAGLAAARPDDADRLALELIARAPLDAIEALAELQREEGSLLPAATAAALGWTRGQLAASGEDSRLALLQALDAELSGVEARDELGRELAHLRSALDTGDIAMAVHHARVAVDEIASAADWLERASDDDPIDRRHSMRLLRSFDRELFADNALAAALALAPDGDPMRPAFASALESLERALLTHEVRPEAGAVAHGGLRIARLRALVRILDGVRALSDADLGSRLTAVNRLMARASEDRSTLRRAVWAALTRAGDALLRDGYVEVTDLLLAWTMTFPDEDFAIVHDASMVPELEAAFAAYAALHRAAWQASDPSNSDAVRNVVERLAELTDRLPADQSPRVEAVRLALARLAAAFARITAVTSQAAVPAGAFFDAARELGALARRTFGACTRLGVPLADERGQLETAVRAIDNELASGTQATLEEAIGHAIDAARAALPAALAAMVERVALWLAHRPLVHGEASTTPLDVTLPSWVPLSRQLGSFYVLRPIGQGAGGSVLLAVRSEERARADRELVALKVPDYAGSAARVMSEQQFEALFREEAGALLALPAHRHLARFITFDASARPKPVLAMEFVRGINLERALELGRFDTGRALRAIDDLLGGLEAMHAAHIAHLDVKPANLVLRDGTGDALLVDFGLAGRRLRPGCGSVRYGAAEVWGDDPSVEPFAADVYAAGCVAFEVLTGTLLMRGDSLKEVIEQHRAPQPAASVLSALGRAPRLASLAELVRAAVARDPSRRPSAARLRAGFSSIAPELKSLSWPLGAATLG